MSRFFGILILCVSGSILNAQQRMVANGLGGFVIAHRTVMQHLVTGHTSGGELAWEKTFRGTRSWHNLYRYPSAGLSLLVLDLGNPEQLGTAYGLTPYLRLPLSSRNDHLAFKFGLGLGFLPKHYERVENHKNIAIGTGLNASVVLGLWYKVPLFSHAALQAGIQFQHFSNGSFRSPNLGINLPMLALGLQFGNQARLPLSEVETIPEPGQLPVKSRIYLSPRIGIKELMVTGHKKYLTTALHLSRNKVLSYKYSYNLFVDVMYNSSLPNELGDTGVKLKNRLYYSQIGAGAGMENHYGRFAIYLQMGAYLYNKQPDNHFYHRLGIKHDIGKRSYISFGLKSHFAKADYIELGWGINLSGQD